MTRFNKEFIFVSFVDVKTRANHSQSPSDLIQFVSDSLEFKYP